ncbi:MAG: hypothetical protein CMB28_01250 [Euryarchaeota archaeon]|nr:hypothetical protein [Euryarchaeota archaeon]|tara:strand:- start:4243 stop:5046 length:804 start_codon:yes stop_codon:yes gene_type:complete
MRPLIAALIMALCLTSSTAAMAEGSSEEHWLRRTVLVEERTAIWCTTCAEIDPELAIVAKSHGARTAIVGLHVEDAFENDASLARIEYQKQIDDSPYGTPTFFVDGIKTAEGYDAWGDVQQRILSQENSRSSPEEMAMILTGENIQLPTPDYGQITLMIIEHDKAVPAGVDNPGEDVRDRVLVGMRVINTEGNITEYGDLELPELWSLVMIHEPVEGGSPYGVVEISNIDYEEDSNNELLLIVAFCVLLGGLLVFIPAKNSLNTEEE